MIPLIADKRVLNALSLLGLGCILFAFFLGGMLAVLVRTELLSPGKTIVDTLDEQSAGLIARQE